MVDQPRKKVLILCTGNSCRSQMAEALINGRMPDSWVAYSAGAEPKGYIHLLALKALNEIGIGHFGKSKNIADLPKIVFNLVITVCDDAAENCPTRLSEGKRVHLGFPDPALAEGSEADRLDAFRSVRDDMSDKILSFLENYPVESPS
ncbi:MAG: arsenate reductase ArsC [Chloroflexi bacterium]|nr:MAG: arsenate reductase ArsC [Chloroflexota bacterium]